MNALLFGAFAAFVIVSPGPGNTAKFFNNEVFNGLILIPALICLLRGFNVPSERRVWLAIGVGILFWWAGDFYSWKFLSGNPEHASPSIADGFYLLFYPAVFVGMFALLRRLSDIPRTLWLQGVIAALAVAAVDAALVLVPLQHATTSSAAELATSLAYPMADLMILMVVFGAAAVAGGRLGSAWDWLTGAVLLMCIADSLFLYQSTTGQYTPGRLLDLTWPGAMLLMAAAAVRDDGEITSIEMDRKLLVVPSVCFALIAMGLVVADHFVALGIQTIAPATAALVIVVLEMALSQRESITLLEKSRQEAFIDSTTGMPNRRALMRDLKSVCRNATEEAPTVILMFDLRGFKVYNDKYGHLAGDALLGRLGGNLMQTVRDYGSAYRHSGDEFCVVSHLGPEHLPGLSKIGREALVAQGMGFDVSALCGYATIPTESRDPLEVLKLADQRMYAEKYHYTTMAPQEAATMVRMLQASATVNNKRSALINQTVQHAAALMGLAGDQLVDIARAFQLRDIGNCAIPDEILNKQGKLAPHEWAIVRSHTIVGERILNAIPVLRPVAEIVRYSHERDDGEGYPDGLAKEAIPVGSRLVAIAAAFDAMISDRPFRAALTYREAVHQLGSGAGSQFDPRSVSAFCQALDRTADAIQQRVASDEQEFMAPPPVVAVAPIAAAVPASAEVAAASDVVAPVAPVASVASVAAPAAVVEPVLRPLSVIEAAQSQSSAAPRRAKPVFVPAEQAAPREVQPAEQGQTIEWRPTVGSLN